MNELLTLREAADRLGVHITTIQAWVRDGKIRSYRLGKRFARVDWDEVLDELTQHRDDPAPARHASKTSRVEG